MLTFPLKISLHRNTRAFSFVRRRQIDSPCLNGKDRRQDSQIQRIGWAPIWHTRSFPWKYTLPKNGWGKGVPGMLNQMRDQYITIAFAFPSTTVLESKQSGYPFLWETKDYSNSHSRRLAIAWSTVAFSAEIYTVWSEKSIPRKRILREQANSRVKEYRTVLSDFLEPHTTK